MGLEGSRWCWRAIHARCMLLCDSHRAVELLLFAPHGLLSRCVIACSLLQGLFMTGGLLVTDNEPEGFRRAADERTKG